MRFPVLPPITDPKLAVYLRDMAQYVQIMERGRTPDATGHHSTILLAPDGAAWEVTIDDNGALTSTKVQE